MFTNNQETDIKEQSFYEEIGNKTMRWPSFGIKCSDDEMLTGNIKSSTASFASLLSQDGIVPEGSFFGEKHNPRHTCSSSSTAGNVVDIEAFEMRKSPETWAFNLKSILKCTDKQLSKMSSCAKHQLKVRFASPVVHVKLIEELEENSEDDSDTLILTPDHAEMNDKSLILDSGEIEDQKVPIHSQGNDDSEFCAKLEPFQEELCSKHYLQQTDNGTVHGAISKHIPVFCFPNPIACKSFSLSLSHLEAKKPDGPLTSYWDADERPGCSEYKGLDEYPSEKKTCGVEEFGGSDERKDCSLLKLVSPDIQSLDVISEPVKNVTVTNCRLATPDDADKVTHHDEDLFQNSEDKVQVIRNSSQEPISVQVVPCISRSEDIVCQNPFQVSKTSIKTTISCASVRDFLATAIIEESLLVNIDTDDCSTNASVHKPALFPTEDLDDNISFYIGDENASDKFDYGKPEEFTCSPIKELIKSANENECLYELSLRTDLMDTLDGRLDSQISINTSSPNTMQPSVAPYLLGKTTVCENELLKNSEMVLEIFTCSPIEQGCKNDFMVYDPITRTPFNDSSEHCLNSQSCTESEMLQLSCTKDNREKDENSNDFHQPEKLKDCFCNTEEKSFTNKRCLDKVFLNNHSNSKSELVGRDSVKYQCREGHTESIDAVSVMKKTNLDYYFASSQPHSKNLCEVKMYRYLKEVPVKTPAMNKETENDSYAQHNTSCENSSLSKAVELSDNTTILEDLNLHPKRKKGDKNTDDTVSTKRESSNLKVSSVIKRAGLKEQEETMAGKRLMSEVDIEGLHSNQKETALCSQAYRLLVSITEQDSRHKCKEDMFQPQRARECNCKGFDQNKWSDNRQNTLEVQSANEDILQEKVLCAEGTEVAQEMKGEAITRIVPSTLTIDIRQLNEPELLEALTIDIGKLNEPELLDAAMLLVEDAVKKPKVEKPNSVSVETTSKHSNSTPVFFWKNKFSYNSKQLELVETLSTDLSETNSFHHSKSETRRRPLRMGLSRRQKVKKLHPYWEKGRTATPQESGNKILH